MWIADQECEVKLLQQLSWDHRWVARLCIGAIWEWRLVGGAIIAFGLILCANSALLDRQGRGYVSWFALGRYQIIGDVFDKDAFSLGMMSIYLSIGVLMK